MGLLPLAPKASASANFATPANVAKLPETAYYFTYKSNIIQPCGYRISVLCVLAKDERGVRLPLPAPRLFHP